jgi:hypothetical protein
MSDYVIWHIVSDARAAGVVAARCAALGVIAVSAQPATALEPAAGDDAALSVAAVVVAVVSAAALADQRFDAPMTARLVAGRPTLIALTDLSSWEFSLRRPDWLRRVGPEAVLPAGTDADAPAWLDWLASVTAVPEPGAQSGPRPAGRAETPARQDQPATDAAATSPATPAWLDPNVLFQRPAWSLGDTVPTSVSDTPPVDTTERTTTPGDPPWTDAQLAETEDAAAQLDLPAAPGDEARAAAATIEPTPNRDPAPVSVAPGRRRRAAVTHEHRAPLPASRPGPRRNPGCTCLLWLVGVVVGLIVLAVVAFIALVAIGSMIPDSVDDSPAATVQAVAPAEPSPEPTLAPTSAPAAVSPTARATPTRQVTSTAATTSTAQRLLRDTFGSPATGLLPRAAPDSAGYRLAYEQGEYVMGATGAGTPPAIMAAALTGDFANLTLAVDVRLIGDPADRTIVLACRDRGTVGSAGYRLRMNPERGQVTLTRADGERETPLVDWRSAPAVRQNNQTNRLELRCLGTTISGFVNGTQVASASDRTHQAGTAWLGASTARAGASEARFDNLTGVGLAGRS